jgi:hypothetical protein
VYHLKQILHIRRHLSGVTSSSTIEVRFLNPRDSAILEADVSLICTGDEALKGLTAGQESDAFLTARPGESFELVVSRNQRVIEPTMTFGEAGVVDGDTITIVIERPS